MLGKIVVDAVGNRILFNHFWGLFKSWILWALLEIILSNCLSLCTRLAGTNAELRLTYLIFNRGLDWYYISFGSLHLGVSWWLRLKLLGGLFESSVKVHFLPTFPSWIIQTVSLSYCYFFLFSVQNVLQFRYQYPLWCASSHREEGKHKHPRRSEIRTRGVKIEKSTLNLCRLRHQRCSHMGTVDCSYFIFEKTKNE